ncbi:hypothetical protein FOZ60_014658 [Perkinsus olseni]|uniref:Zinc finger MYM-type protein 1 n=1 Tax=Perkinsus olseni TaxID=32597 RepID=A0A7J6PMB9_PEROL|nr:hypothetical protein FOZ60_014658 [Perkinsus olseni]
MSKITDFFPQKCRNPTSEFSDTTAIPLPDRAEDASQPAAGIQEPPQKRAKKYLSSFERFPWLERVEESSTRHVTAYRCRTCVRMGLQGKWGTIPMLAKGDKLSKKCQKHDESKTHRANMVASGQANRVQEGIDRNISEQVWASASSKYKQELSQLEELCRLAYCCYKLELPHTTIYDKLVRIVGSSPGAALGGYLENAPHNANYASKFTAVEMLEICGQVMRDRITSSIQTTGADGVCLIADESTVKGVTGSYLCVMVRHLDPNTAEPKESLIDLKRVKKTDGQSIFNAISSSLDRSAIDISWVTALSFDGGANFSGVNRGVRSYFPESVLYCHCRAHALALCIKSAASQLCPRINACLDFCASLYDHFGRSNAKSVALEDAQCEASSGAGDSSECDLEGDEFEPRAVALKLLRPVGTRWLSQGIALSRVLRIYTPLASALNRLAEERDFTSGGFLTFMLKRTTIECLVHLDLLLQVTNNFSKMLQSSTLDFAQLDVAKEGFLACIDSFDEREDIAPKIEEIMKGLQSAGFEVVGPRVSGRGGLSELDSLYEEFDAFLAGIRNEISRRFNGAVVCVTKAIQSIALTAQGSAEESDAWTCERAEAVGRSLSWDEHDINGLVAEATSFTKVSRAMLSMPSSVDKLSTGVSSTVKRLVRDPIVKSGFPLHFRLLHLSLVAATNSASPERSFSAVKRLMRQTRQSTTSSHLADLVITAKEGPECNDDVTVRDIAREMARRFMAKRKGE